MPPTLLNAFLDLALLLLSCVVATGAGALALRWSRVSCSSACESFFFAFAAGLGVAGYAVFLLASFRRLTPEALGAFVALLVFCSAAGWVHLLRTAGRPSPSARTAAPRNVPETVAALLLPVPVVLALVLALAPETGKDALVYHLAVPKQYLRSGGFRFIPGNIFSNYPLHGEMLYVPALALRGEVLAKLLHFAALVGILAGMAGFSRRHLPENAFPRTGLLLFATIPTVFAVSHTAYTDLFVALFSTAAFFAHANAAEDDRKGWFVLSGAFTGFAVSCKYTALILPLLGILGILVASRRRGGPDRAVPAGLLLYIAPAVLFGAPYYVKNLFLAGNPFHPFLYGIFGGRGWSAEQAQLYDGLVAHLGMGRGWLDFLLLPWNVSVNAEMDSPRFDGMLGPAFLLILPFLAGVRRIDAALKSALAFCLAWFLFWASSAQQMRYLIPVFPFLALAAGVVLSHYRSFGPRWTAALLVAFAAGSLALNGARIAGDFRRIAPIGVIAGSEATESYMRRNVPLYGMYAFAGAGLPPGSRIFLVYMRNYTYLCREECYSDAMFESYTMQKILRAAGTPEDVLRSLRAGGFTHVMYDDRFVSGDLSLFSPEEKAMFSRFVASHAELLHREGTAHLVRIAAPGSTGGSRRGL